MYDNIVLKTRPAHYFPLSSSSVYDKLIGFGNVNVYTGAILSGGTDQQYAASAIVPKTGYVFPIISNSGSGAGALKVTKTSLYNFTAQYTKLDSMFFGAGTIAYNFEINNYNKDFSISFWLNFNNQINGQTNITATNQVLIYNIVQAYGNVTNTKSLLEIYFDYPTSTFRLKFPDPDNDADKKDKTITTRNTEAICYVDKLDQSFQITATYSKGQIILRVNDQIGTGFVSKNSFIFYSNPFTLQGTTPNLTFNFTGTSLGDSSTPNYIQNYLVSSLAYYQRILSDSDLDTLSSFAFQDGFPVSQSMVNDNAYFDFREIGNFDEFTAPGGISIESGLTGKYGDYQKLYGTNFKIGDIDNLNLTKNGLTPIKFTKPYFVKNDYTTYIIDSSKGIQVSGGYVTFSDTEYFDFSSKATITSTLSGLASLSPSTTRKPVWFLECGDTYLGLTILRNISGTSHSYLLDEYSKQTNTITKNLIQKDFNASGNDSDSIAIAFSNKSIILNSASYGTASTSTSFSNTYIVGNSDNLYIGNGPGSSGQNVIYIKNFGIINKNITNYSFFDFTNPSTIMFRFTSSANPFLVSQLGTWTYIIPTAIYPTCTVVGTQFNWNRDNCKISISSDGGVTYSKILPYQSATGLNLSSVLNNLKIKMEMQTEYDYDGTFNSNFSQMEYLVYTNQTIHSNGNSVYIANNNTDKANYTISSQNSMMSRHKNFGIKFMGDSNKSPASASIVNSASTGFQTIDLWYRPDAIASGSSNYLINNVAGSATAPVIWLNASARFQSLGGTLYINGASVADNTITASANELYHIVLSLSASSTSSLYLNGGVLGASAISGSATYGHITLWNDQLTSNQILNRYQSYYYSNTASANDDNTKKYFSTSSTDSFKVFRLNY
jgi:hypothetical protein